MQCLLFCELAAAALDYAEKAAPSLLRRAPDGRDLLVSTGLRRLSITRWSTQLGS